MKQTITNSLIALSILSTMSIASEINQNIDIGILNTTGNTKTSNINGKYTMDIITTGFKQEKLNVKLNASAFLTKNNGEKDNEEFNINIDAEQKVLNNFLGYTSIDWLQNKFKNFDNKLSVGLGLGKEIFKDKEQSLKVKLGTSYNLEQFTNNQEDEDYLGLNQYIEYNNKLNKISSLYAKLSALENIKDFNDYEATTIVGVLFKIAQNLSLTLEEEMKYNNTPSQGFNSTDTKTLVRVGYKF